MFMLDGREGEVRGVPTLNILAFLDQCSPFPIFSARGGRSLCEQSSIGVPSSPPGVPLGVEPVRNLPLWVSLKTSVK